MYLKPRLVLLISLITCFQLFISEFIFAQTDSKANALLEEVSKKYELIKSYKADFTYQLENPQAKVNEKSTGEINVKGDKYTLKLGSQEIINDGTTVWTYMRDENEVNISDYAPDEDEIVPTKIYSIYKTGFKSVIVEEEKIKGMVYYAVDLIPENKKRNFFKIRLWINKKDKSISKWKVFEKNGNRYLFTLENFIPAPKLDEAMFVFDKSKHAGVEVIDLR